MDNKKTFPLMGGLLALIALSMLAAGLLTPVCLGDESYHFRKAWIIFKFGRLGYDPVFDAVPFIASRISNGPLWHYGLALLWKIFGVSQPMAQIYQLGYFCGTLALTFYAAKLLKSTPEQSIWSVVLVASAPMMIVYGVVLYVDIPTACLWMLTYVLLLKRRYVWAGAAWAGLTYMKESGLLFLPAIYFLILLLEASWKEKVKAFALFSTAGFVVLFPDILYRLRTFGAAYVNPTVFPKRELVNYVPLSMINQPLMAFGSLGAGAVAGIVFYSLRRKFWSFQDKFAAVPLVIFSSIILFIFFRRTMEPRYFMPVFPLLCLLAAKGIALIPKIGKAFIGGLCILQIIASLVLVVQKRRLPEGIWQAFSYADKNFSMKDIMLYPEDNFILYAQRPIVWTLVPHFYQLFFGPTSEDIYAAIKEARIRYIGIPAHRVYDDSKFRHTGGIPRSFVNRIASGELSFLKSVYANDAIHIYRVLPE